MPIESWSHSRLSTFEQCKFRAKQLFELKVKEPQRPLPAGKTEHANDRGTRVHEACELFVRGQAPVLTREAMSYEAEFNALRDFYSQGIVSLEGEWGMNRAWEPCNWRGEWLTLPSIPAGETFEKVKTLPSFAKAGAVYQMGTKFLTWVPAWLRLKLDCLVFVSKYEAIVIDYKTGKKFGNELKHGEQLNLYQLVTFLRHPELELVHAELWYLDANDLTSKTFTRDQGLRFKRSWDKRGNNITTADAFPPNPNIHTCRWCMLGERPGGAGICKVGKW